MKPAPVKTFASSSNRAHHWLLSPLHWVGILVLSAVILLGSACTEPGSGSGIDPGVIEIPVAFINRPIPVNNNGNTVQTDLREPLIFSQGGDVFLRTNSTSSATVTNITSSVTLGMGDVKGLNSSYDGRKLIFSLRLFDADVNNPPTPAWNIYEYDLDTQVLRPIITNPFTAEEGDDLYPAYLPDGRILFSSNRQTQSREMLLAELKPRFSALDEVENELALVLHVMDPDGNNIRQISFNQSHDLQPQVLTGQYAGQIVFSRWDNTAGNNSVNLYKANPDGSDLELIYGRHSHATGSGGGNIQFTGVREMNDGKLMVIAKPFSGTFDGGDIFIINVDQFVDIDKPIYSLAGLPGPAQVAATVNNVNTTPNSISRDGRYTSAFPLRDGSDRVLVSKSTCQLLLNNLIRPCIEPELSDPASVDASPPYAIWLYDLKEDTQKVVVLAQPGRVITEAIAMQALPLPPVIFDRSPPILNSGWRNDGVGVVNIKSVYDMGDTSFNGCFFTVCESAPGAITSVMDFADPLNALAAERPARFVRFVKAVAIPDPNDPILANPPDLLDAAFGPTRNRGMREIAGYTMVEPDGSVKVKVPANVPLGVEVLDSEGRRIGPPHQNWFQVQPGDTLNCNGCHTHATGGPTPEVHSRSDADAPSINTGLPFGLQFPNTQIPGTTTAYWGNFGDTMAEVRFDRAGDTMPNPSAEAELTADLFYEDYWTDVAARAPDLPYDFLYSRPGSLITSPVNSFCGPPWEFNCRIIINYPFQIHPIWQQTRIDDMGTPLNPLDDVDNTCILCHTTTDAMGNDRVADGQLDLSTDPAQNLNDSYRAYQELLFADQGQRLDAGGNLEDIEILVPDGMGGFVLVPDPAFAVTASMSEDGARLSYFAEKMTNTELDDTTRVISGALDHSGMLTPDELKLIYEWLDLGAQNFNNPFDLAAPKN